MGKEIDLLRNYPKSRRNIADRAERKSKADQQVARRFGREFFDGDRKVGYGGFSYHSRFWQHVVPDFQQYWGLSKNSSILDVGCAKGFMLYDFQRLIPGIKVRGVDVSNYAIECGMAEVKDCLSVASCVDLPFESNSFDYTISITTVHNVEYNDCVRALREIERVSKKGSFITVDAYRNNEEKKRMDEWNLTALTILHVEEWKELFDKAEYSGDYYWFIP